MAERQIPRLKHIADFSKFAPGDAQDLSLILGKMMADIGDLEAADKWFSVAAAVAANMHPPNATFEGRVSLALRTMSKGLERFADAIDRATEQHAANVAAQQAKANAMPAGQLRNRRPTPGAN